MALKKVMLRQLGRTVKMGRTRPPGAYQRLSFAKYFRGALPSAPATVDYSAPAASVLANVYLNDQLGDCVIAGGYHGVGVETGNAGDLFTASSQQLIQDYSAIGGYVPGDPKTDNGCNEVTAFNYWTSTGFKNGTKALGWLAVDQTDPAQMRTALYLFENLFFGMELPDAWVNPTPASSGFTWDVAGAPDPNNGHFVTGVGYTANGVTIDTWGMLGTLTWAAINNYCSSANSGGVYVILTPDQLAKGQAKAPNGFDWTALINDFNALGGSVPVPSPKPPSPSPKPPSPSPKPPSPSPKPPSPSPKPPSPSPKPPSPSPKPPAPQPPSPQPPTPGGTGTTGVAQAAWMPPPFPPYAPYAAYPPPPPLPPQSPPTSAPSPVEVYAKRALAGMARSPALGVVAVVGLVVLGVVSVVGLAGSTHEDE